MLDKLNKLREEREDAFTLIEILVVILIIGILAAIAIPVFLNQRQTANDAAVESDVRNAASQVETWIAQKGGENVIITAADVSSMKIKESAGVMLYVNGSSNAYCVRGVHENGKKYDYTTVPITPDSTLSYESSLGGMGKGNSSTAWLGSCTQGTITVV